MLTSQIPDMNKNVLDDLWQDCDYETLEKRYYEIKRAKVRASKNSTEEGTLTAEQKS